MVWIKVIIFKSQDEHWSKDIPLFILLSQIVYNLHIYKSCHVILSFYYFQLNVYLLLSEKYAFVIDHRIFFKNYLRSLYFYMKHVWGILSSVICNLILFIGFVSVQKLALDGVKCDSFCSCRADWESRCVYWTTWLMRSLWALKFDDSRL